MGKGWKNKERQVHDYFIGWRGINSHQLKIMTYESVTYLPMTNVLISNVKENRFWDSYLPTFLHDVMKYPVYFFWGRPLEYFFYCHRVKSSLFSLELPFRSPLQSRQTSRWRFLTAWQFIIKGVNYIKIL